MPKNIKHITLFILTFALVLFTLSTNAQEVRVIDNKGTIATVNNHKVTASISAPSSPNTNDIWFDTSNLITNVWDGSSWIAIVSKHTAGDIKHGVQSTDHNGWYLLDGRAITSLSTTAQAAATGLSLGTNLPDANDRVLKHPTGGQSIGTNGGQTSISIKRTNLPNITFTGVITNQSNHNHTISISERNVTQGIWGGSATVMEPGGTINTSEDGAHDHGGTVTVSTGGNETPINIYQPYLVVNTFIYLGL